jgi:hypothetical protein
MGDDATLGMGLSAGLNLAHGETWRARCNDHVRRQQFIELTIKILLEIDPLGSILLDEVRASHRRRQVSREGELRL